MQQMMRAVLLDTLDKVNNVHNFILFLASLQCWSTLSQYMLQHRTGQETLTHLWIHSTLFNLKSEFGLVWFSCIPSFNLLLCLELVKKFTVVAVVAGGVESNFSVIFGPNLKTQTLLRTRPKLNNMFCDMRISVFCSE